MFRNSESSEFSEVVDPVSTESVKSDEMRSSGFVNQIYNAHQTPTDPLDRRYSQYPS